jgi:hypothetical protein
MSLSTEKRYDGLRLILKLLNEVSPLVSSRLYTEKKKMHVYQQFSIQCEECTLTSRRKVRSTDRNSNIIQPSNVCAVS